MLEPALLLPAPTAGGVSCGEVIHRHRALSPATAAADPPGLPRPRRGLYAHRREAPKYSSRYVPPWPCLVHGAATATDRLARHPQSHTSNGFLCTAVAAAQPQGLSGWSRTGSAENNQPPEALTREVYRSAHLDAGYAFNLTGADRTTLATAPYVRLWRTSRPSAFRTDIRRTREPDSSWPPRPTRRTTEVNLSGAPQKLALSHPHGVEHETGRGLESVSKLGRAWSKWPKKLGPAKPASMRQPAMSSRRRIGVPV